MESSILTTSSKQLAVQSSQNYADAVDAHLNGDWTQHSQASIINAPWYDASGVQIPGSKKLRLVISVNGADLAVVLPVIPA